VGVLMALDSINAARNRNLVTNRPIAGSLNNIQVPVVSSNTCFSRARGEASQRVTAVSLRDLHFHDQAVMTCTVDSLRILDTIWDCRLCNKHEIEIKQSTTAAILRTGFNNTITPRNYMWRSRDITSPEWP
jgi:hypothetical protein